MRWHSVDYTEDRKPGVRTPLLDRGFWLSDVPRLILRCRLFGHKPVVDGVDYGTQGQRNRWVVCDRCGIRPQPQGSLDADEWTIGQIYDGAFDVHFPTAGLERRQAISNLKGRTYPPGPWPASPKSDLGGQLIIGRTFGGVGVELKIGNKGSEQTVAGDLCLYPLGALYLHLEEHGRGLQRRLNPASYTSRVTGVSIRDGDLNWRVWADRDGLGGDQPRWRYGWVDIDPRDLLLGPKVHEHTNVGEPQTVTVRMPHGDDHTVSVTLQKVLIGRRRWRRTQTWSAKWHCAEGIPTKPNDGGRIISAFVDVSHEAVKQGTWPLEAAVQVATRMTHDRISRGYKPAPAPNSAE